MTKHRGGARIGHDVMLDHMYTDGLEDAYDGKLMGAHAEETALSTSSPARRRTPMRPRA
jgi:acetyl-CoA C-acetyltransferase